MRRGFINENCWNDDPIELYVDIDLFHENNNAAACIIAYGTIDDLKAHNEKIARAAVKWTIDMFVSEEEFEKLSNSYQNSFLQSDEYKALSKEVPE